MSLLPKYWQPITTSIVANNNNTNFKHVLIQSKEFLNNLLDSALGFFVPNLPIKMNSACCKKTHKKKQMGFYKVHVTFYS